jgi:uncharacterized iron-regulated membrane protein
MNKKFKDIVRQIHLWLGLATGLVVLVISIAGALYVFEEEIRAATQKDFRFVPAQEKPFVGLDQIITQFNQLEPKAKLRLIRVTEQYPNATVELSTSKDEVYYFNPYTAALVSKRGLDWLEIDRKLHTSLLLGEPGEFIMRWSVVIFVLMLISGLILWFPGKRRLLKQSLTIKRNASFKRLNYDLHNVLGFYAALVLLITALTGLYFAFKEVKTIASFFTGTKLTSGKTLTVGKVDTIESVALRYHKIYQEASKKYPGAVSTSFSVRGKGELRLRIIYPYKWARNQNTFFYDEASGTPLRAKLYQDYNAADLIEATNFDLHTGKLFGMPHKIFSFFASLIAASLPITGFIIWWKKRRR